MGGLTWGLTGYLPVYDELQLCTRDSVNPGLLFRNVSKITPVRALVHVYMCI